MATRHPWPRGDSVSRTCYPDVTPATPGKGTTWPTTGSTFSAGSFIDSNNTVMTSQGIPVPSEKTHPRSESFRLCFIDKQIHNFVLSRRHQNPGWLYFVPRKQRLFMRFQSKNHKNHCFPLHSRIRSEWNKGAYISTLRGCAAIQLQCFCWVGSDASHDEENDIGNENDDGRVTRI